MESGRTIPQRVLSTLVTVSPRMRQTVEQAKRLALKSDAVFINGRIGTGRKLLARVIHEESPRGCQPLAIVQSDKLTVDVLDRVLFGDRYGSGIGKMEEAAEGSLLLVDVEDLNPVAQERLLSALVSGRFVNGCGETRLVTCRLLSTGDGEEITRRVRLSQFSEDLFRYLAKAELAMPSLAERRDDIPDLVVSVLNELAVRERIEPPQVPYHYMELLTTVEWPENVQQLRNHVESVMVLSGGQFDPAIIREHFIAEGSPATIMGAVQGLLNKLKAGEPVTAINPTRA